MLAGMGQTGPLPGWEDATCVVCPAQRLGPGAFDVIDRPDPRYAYDPAAGCRVDSESGVPVCVHPFRVGLAPGRYASAGEPVAEESANLGERARTSPSAARARPLTRPPVFVPSPEQLVLPEQADDLEGWLIAMLRTARGDEMASALEQAEAIAGERFSGAQVVDALRRVLATELAGS
jgi:hypothetical protein